MIEYFVDSELGIFSPDRTYDSSMEIDNKYVEWALSIKNPKYTLQAYSYQDEQMSYAK